jgi:hypothetical protein
VTSTAKKILDEALSLPDDERRMVAEVLMDSLVAQEDVDAAWREAILRRVEQVRRGEVELETWDEVRRLGREALASR